MEGKVTPARLLAQIVRAANGLKFNDLNRDERFCYDVLHQLGLAFMSNDKKRVGRCMARKRSQYEWKRGKAV